MWSISYVLYNNPNVLYNIKKGLAACNRKMSCQGFVPWLMARFLFSIKGSGKGQQTSFWGNLVQRSVWERYRGYGVRFRRCVLRRKEEDPVTVYEFCLICSCCGGSIDLFLFRGSFDSLVCDLGIFIWNQIVVYRLSLLLPFSNFK